MTFSELVKKARTVRRFDATQKVELAVLEDIIDTARVSPSPANVQPLRYCIVTDEELCEKIEQHLTWAGYLTDWDGPEHEEKPTAYIILLRDTTLPQIKNYDEGIALQTIQLAATEKGLGVCCFGAFNEKEVLRLIDITEPYSASLVIALGYPKETVILEDIKPHDNKDNADAHKYYRDADNRHHVPKRSLQDIIVKRLA